MRPELILAMLVVVLGAMGTYLLLPHRHGLARPRQAHLAGAGLAGLAVVLLALFWTPPSGFLASLFFYGFSLAAIACGILMITSRDPVQSALWFAGVVLATSGLFLQAGAQFLAAGTVIVYAGAIIVTFLFVIMLAQAEGQALYDRMARAPGRATFCGMLLFWGLLYALLGIGAPAGDSVAGPEPASARAGASLPRIGDLVAPAHIADAGPALVYDRAVRPRTARLPATEHLAGTPPPHVAGLGGTLFADHLIAVEAAGALLLVAMIGAAAIATPKPPVRPLTTQAGRIEN